MTSTVSACVLLALLAACEKEEILAGERFGTRTDLEASIPTPDRPHPVDPNNLTRNQAAPINLPAMQANAEWSHRGGNARHDPPHGSLSAAPYLAWSAPIGKGNSRRNRISAAPVVGEGRIYALDARMGLTATALNGAALWSADLTPQGDRASEISGGGLAYGGGKVFIATSYGELIAVSAASGGVLWRQRLGAAVAGAPAVEGDMVYVVGRDSSAWAVATADGKVRWQLPATQGVTGMTGSSAPAVGDRAVFLPMVSGELVAALKSGGLQTWKTPVVGQRLGRGYGMITDVTGDPVLAGSVIYTGNAAGRSYALDSGSGEVIWSAPEGAMGPMLPVGGSVFLVNDEARLVRLDAASGAVIWSVEMPNYLTEKPRKQKAVTAHYGPVLAGGRIAVASSDGLLRLFSPVDGALVATAPIPGGAAAQPALAGGQLIVVGGDGQLHAFR
ncbi:MAG: PQQ-binding-like beta-propeller repeat protein [Gemmobacter sp.]|jgi:outer membrane protein assembly factor BamB|nr:PQQ-binding-like beta-propeller repeat protein [Gemmobacter sp.]